MSIRTAVTLHSRLRHALVGPARMRDSVVVIVGALLCAGLIFGLLYDVFDSTLRRWTDRDLNRRSHLIGVAMQASSRNATPDAMQRLLGDLSSTDDAANLVACSPAGMTIAASGITRGLGCRSALARAALQTRGKSTRGILGSHSVVVTAHPIGAHGTLFVVQDRTFLDTRRKHVLQILFVSAEFALLAFLLLARAGARIGSRRTEEAARSVVRQMRSRTTADVPIPPDLRLLVRDMHDAVQHLRTENGGGRDGAERLRQFVNAEIPSGGLIVIANREPYAHQFDEGGNVVVRQPASGLVTGIEPMLRACGGTWIAHGSGSADRVTADRMGRVAVPPGTPEYTLRRLWIEEEAYERYYSGFANEGIWPLCHIAHTQPSFRALDWIAYQAVNETFARAAIEEASADGLLLIQDYHFALVPKLVRDQAPHVVTCLFWHIPWPNSEIAGICPWKESILDGMLGADVIGFHTQQYCLNFLDTVQRYLECRVDLETMSVSYGGHRTEIRTYPISVEWPYPAAPRADGAELRASLGIARRYYAMADSALVTPLHDGMNLVAKEYVAACNDGVGALVLSVFAGASKELDGALLVNPYDTQQVAETILRAILMPAAERRARMQTMRDQIASHSIYNWSEKLLTDMRSIRQQRARFWPQRIAPQRGKPREVVAG